MFVYCDGCAARPAVIHLCRRTLATWERGVALSFCSDRCMERVNHYLASPSFLPTRLTVGRPIA